MLGIDTLHQGDGLGKNGDVALDDSLHHLCRRIFTTTEMTAFQVGVNNTLTAHAGIDLQAFIFFAILGMIHVLN